jgi:hypothetical protein
MTGICRMVVIPGGKILSYESCEGDTYETALLSFHLNPDTVLIFYHGVSLPQDKPIEEDEVEIIMTCHTGCGTGCRANEPENPQDPTEQGLFTVPTKEEPIRCFLVMNPVP